MNIHKVDFGNGTATWKCSNCGTENPYDKETADKALAIAAESLKTAAESLKTIPAALLFGALKAIGWLCLGIAALKFSGVI